MATHPFDLTRTFNEALAQHRQGQLREADKLYARVLKAAPGHFDALHLGGLARAQGGALGEALRMMTAALRINPDAPDAWSNLANVLQGLKRPDEALTAIDKARALSPDDASLMLQRGSLLLSLGRAEEALAAFEGALARDATPQARLGRGTALALLGRAADALADFDAVLAAAPMTIEALYNRGNALADLDRPLEALATYDRLLARVPNHARGLHNRARALQALNRHDEAVAAYDKAIALNKDWADAQFNRAQALLTAGRLKEGFAAYEWRWSRSGMEGARRKLNKPLWLGEFTLTGKTILLHAEQGLGDTIQFARYVPMLADSGARVIVEVPAALTALFGTLDGVTAVVAKGDALPAFNVHCPFASLPLALKTDTDTIPAPIPYLKPDQARIDRWRPRLEGLSGKRVAIAWAGQASHVNDRNRSMRLEQLAPLFDVAGVNLISLQRDLRDEDAATLAATPSMTALGMDLGDMADTAAVIAQCDLVIAVDTAIVHLAAALGRPFWVMLPYVPDWRWTLKGDSTPWYPHARLFRQQHAGDWASVVSSVAQALAG